MKKILITLLTLTLMLTGCSAAKQTAKLKVYTSFSLLTDLTQRIVKDKVELHTVIENGEEPHDYEISTKQMTELSKADAIIYNGVEFESWIDKVKEVAKTTTFVDTSNGIKVLEGDEDHDHEEEHEEHEEHDHHHDHNPHIWMSIKNAMQQLTTIKDAMVKLDASNKAFYEENYKTAIAEFTKLEAEYASKLSNTKRKTVVVSHAAYTYLLNDYGLEEHAISGFTPDSEPSLARLADLTKLVKEEDVTTVFFDENVTSSVSNVLAKEANVKTAVLYTLEKAVENEDYLSLMRKNLDALEKALNE